MPCGSRTCLPMNAPNWHHSIRATQRSRTRAATNATADFNGDGAIDFDFTPAVSTSATVGAAMPTILEGQKVFIAAPANPLPGLTIQRTGRLDSNDLPTPYSMQYNAGVQRELGWNSIIDVNFIYSRTTHEFMQDADIANFFPGNGAPRVLGDGTLPSNLFCSSPPTATRAIVRSPSNMTSASVDISSTPPPMLCRD